MKAKCNIYQYLLKIFLLKSLLHGPILSILLMESTFSGKYQMLPIFAGVLYLVRKHKLFSKYILYIYVSCCSFIALVWWSQYQIVFSDINILVFHLKSKKSIHCPGWFFVILNKIKHLSTEFFIVLYVGTDVSLFYLMF